MSATQQDKHISTLRPVPSAQLYLLRRGLGLWQLTFQGEKAVLKHQPGIYFVAYLLTHPQPEPVSALVLALRVADLFKPAASPTAELSNGMQKSPESSGQLESFSLQLEAARSAWALRSKQLELEALVDDEGSSEPVRAEALRELEGIYECQERNLGHLLAIAQRAAPTIRRAIARFQQQLLCARDLLGRPDPVLRAFEEHLNHFMLIPSARCSARSGTNLNYGLSSRFTYEPPNGVVWMN